MCTKLHEDWSIFVGEVGFLVFFTKFKMAGNLSRRSLWVLEANLFIGRRDTSVQNFMSVQHTGPEIQPFKVRNFERSL